MIVQAVYAMDEALTMISIPPIPCLDCGTLVYNGKVRCVAHHRAARRRKDHHRTTAPGDGAAARVRRAYLANPGSYACAACLNADVKLSVDHHIPLIDGGTDYSDNIRLLCVPCHRTKTGIESDARGPRVPFHMRHKEEY